MAMIILVLGGGDLASGVAYRLQRVGLRVAMTELPQPLAVRRLVSFAEAIYAGECNIEGITAKKVTDHADTLRILRIFANGQIPVMIDPQAESRYALHPAVIIDARRRRMLWTLDGMKRPYLLAWDRGSMQVGIVTQRSRRIEVMPWGVLSGRA